MFTSARASLGHCSKIIWAPKHRDIHTPCKAIVHSHTSTKELILAMTESGFFMLMERLSVCLKDKCVCARVCVSVGKARTPVGASGLSQCTRAWWHSPNADFFPCAFTLRRHDSLSDSQPGEQVTDLRLCAHKHTHLFLRAAESLVSRAHRWWE